MDIVSICTGLDAPPPTDAARELFVRRRLRLPLESTRLGPIIAAADMVGLPGFGRRLEETIRGTGATRVHCVPHGLDFWAAFAAARSLGLPFFISVHDDLRYSLRRCPHRALALALMARVWRGASHRFVITEALGNEYDARYGARTWTVVTDGVELSPPPGGPECDALRVWFMGSMHVSYRHNLKALLAALPVLDTHESGARGRAQLICRGGAPDPGAEHGRVEVRPFAAESVARADARDVHVAYLPLPFGAEHADFVRYSLPTKLITYLACGRPILVHGPSRSSAAQLVSAHGAGVVVDNLDPAAVAEGLRAARLRGASLVKAARRLAERDFGLGRARKQFWSHVLPAAQ